MDVGFALLVEGGCGVHVEPKDMPEERVADMRFTLRRAKFNPEKSTRVCAEMIGEFWSSLVLLPDFDLFLLEVEGATIPQQQLKCKY